MPRIPTKTTLAYLAQRNFPDYGMLSADTESVARLVRPERRQEFEAWWLRHEAMPKEEVDALVDAEWKKEAEARRTLAEAKERARFFHRTDAAADFVYWGKMAHWTIDEAIALSLGKSPSAVTLDNLTPYMGPTAEGLPPSPFAVEYSKRTELARRSIIGKELYDPVLPSLFLRWAQRMDMNPPPELVAAVETRGSAVLDWRDIFEKEKERHEAAKQRVAELEALVQTAKEGIETVGALGLKNTEALRAITVERDALRAEVGVLQTQLEEAARRLSSEPTLSTVERNSLLRIVYGMATARPYEFNPRAARSEAAPTIASATAAAGCPVTDETVRKWLKAAAELVGKANLDSG